MHMSPTLSPNEFKSVHNGLCELESVIERLADVLKPEIYNALTASAGKIRAGLAGAYEQENISFEQRRKHYLSVAKELKLNTVWSIFEIEDLNTPHKFTDVSTVTYRDHWGPKAIVKPIIGNTWAALYMAADAAIRDSGDEHHVFIENFKQDKSLPSTLILSTGS